MKNKKSIEEREKLIDKLIKSSVFSTIADYKREIKKNVSEETKGKVQISTMQ